MVAGRAKGNREKWAVGSYLFLTHKSNEATQHCFELRITSLDSVSERKVRFSVGLVERNQLYCALYLNSNPRILSNYQHIVSVSKTQ